MSKEKDVRKVKVEPEDQEAEEVGQDVLAEDFEALQAEMSQLQKDAEEAHNRYLRTLADFDNFRKRQRDETARLCDFAKEEVISKLLPILDNFERSVDAAEAQHSYDALVEGVSLTLKGLRDLLDKEGVVPMEAVGQEFNPELHEALMRTHTDEYPEHTILEEFERGYTINGKVIRPARVRVAVPE